MTLLSPWGLLALASIPVLLWIWRFTATQHRRQVPSLAPFLHLLKRQPKRRARLIINALFWLQCAALLAGVLALTQPAFLRPRGRTILAVLDTSSSMGAVSRGGSALDRAKQALLRRIARKRPTEQVFIVATSPLAPLTAQATSDGVILNRAIREASISHLGGNLTTAGRVGRGLLGSEPDETIILTDEPKPEGGAGRGVQWVSVGASLPNAAIVGLDAQGPLCHATESRVVATVQNFSGEANPATLRATHGGRRIAEEHLELSPGERRSVSLAIPAFAEASAEGWLAIELDAKRDALAADDRAWTRLEHHARLPVHLRMQPPLQSAVSGWLAACPTLVSSELPPSSGDPFVMLTDEPDALASAHAGMLFIAPSRPKPLLSYWTVSSGHPIGSYFSSVELVSAPLNLAADSPSGFPVVAALVGGRKVPVVLAEERDGRRLVTARFSPVGVETSTSVALVFFNSLRWLMGSPASQRVGEPLAVAALANAGTVSVRRPDGSTEMVAASASGARYQGATLAGLYIFREGHTEITLAANAFDPLESNVFDPRPSTWRAAEPSMTMKPTDQPIRHPMANLLMMVVLALLVVEWWAYTAKPA